MKRSREPLPRQWQARIVAKHTVWLLRPVHRVNGRQQSTFTIDILLLERTIGCIKLHDELPTDAIDESQLLSLKIRTALTRQR